MHARGLEPLHGELRLRAGAGRLVRVAGHRGDLGRDPRLLEVREQVGIERSLVACLVRDDDSHLLAVAQAARAQAPLHGGGEHRRLVGSCPPQVGGAHLGPVGGGAPRADQRGVALLGDAELVVPRPRPNAVDDGEHGRVPLRPLLAERLHVGIVRRIEADDHRVDLASVDATGVVDLVDVEVDGCRLLVVLLVRREPETTRFAVDRDDGEHDVDGGRADPACARACRADRRPSGRRGARHFSCPCTPCAARCARRREDEPGHQPDDDGDHDGDGAHLHRQGATAQAPPGPAQGRQGVGRPPMRRNFHAHFHPHAPSWRSAPPSSPIGPDAKRASSLAPR